MIDVTNKRSGSLLEKMCQKKKQQELKKIRYKVELINRRLAALEEGGGALHKSAGTLGTIFSSFDASKSHHSGRETKFDARRVFDALDVDSSGHVSFEELNVILALNDLELSEFVRRMNELAVYKQHRELVTRPVFVKYFLQAEFVEHYPRLLLEVTMEADSPLGDDDFDFESRWNYPGIDICFQELSLLIKVGENAINVVDNVSGRIRAKTMTHGVL
jgi:hypothetical protein